MHIDWTLVVVWERTIFGSLFIISYLEHFWFCKLSTSTLGLWFSLFWGSFGASPTLHWPRFGRFQVLSHHLLPLPFWFLPCQIGCFFILLLLYPWPIYIWRLDCYLYTFEYKTMDTLCLIDVVTFLRLSLVWKKTVNCVPDLHCTLDLSMCHMIWLGLYTVEIKFYNIP